MEVEFAAGVSEQTITISIEDDNVYEMRESFCLRLSLVDTQARVQLVSGQNIATVEIIDNDGKFLWESLLPFSHSSRPLHKWAMSLL